MLHFFVNKILFGFAAILLLLDIYVVLFHKGVPNIRTAPAVRKKIVDILKKDFETRPRDSYTVIDLGSGHGVLTREIAKAMPQAKVIGIEFTKQTVAWANMMKRREGIENVSYLEMDFLSYDFSQVDAVYMYMIPPVLALISRKLREEAKEGTLMIANKFPLKNDWIPEETIKVRTFYPHQGKMYVYHKSGAAA